MDPGRGGSGPFTFENPDFNFKSLRLNTVLRWEWRPGSALYAVWTQARENSLNPGRVGPRARPRRPVRLAVHERVRGQGHDPPGRLSRVGLTGTSSAPGDEGSAAPSQRLVLQLTEIPSPLPVSTVVR